jgi:hypothetical protein
MTGNCGISASANRSSDTLFATRQRDRHTRQSCHIRIHQVFQRTQTRRTASATSDKGAGSAGRSCSHWTFSAIRRPTMGRRRPYQSGVAPWQRPSSSSFMSFYQAKGVIPAGVDPESPEARRAVEEYKTKSEKED